MQIFSNEPQLLKTRLNFSSQKEFPVDCNKSDKLSLSMVKRHSLKSELEESEKIKMPLNR